MKQSEHNKKIFDMQVRLEKAWTKSWDKSIQELINMTNRTHVTAEEKIKAIRIRLKARLRDIGRR